MLKNLLSLFKTKPKPAVSIETALYVREPGDKELQVRQLRKEATQLKKQKAYDEAVAKLKEAIELDPSGAMCLRLPMYLQLAGKNDEGWAELQRLNISHIDVFSQADITKQMRIFLEKEKRFRRALDFAVWSICKWIERDRWNISNDQKQHEEFKAAYKEMGMDFDRKPDASFQKMMKDRIKEMMAPSSVTGEIQKLMKKLKKEEITPQLSNDISAYLKNTAQYDLGEVQSIIAKHV